MCMNMTHTHTSGSSGSCIAKNLSYKRAHSLQVGIQKPEGVPGCSSSSCSASFSWRKGWRVGSLQKSLILCKWMFISWVSMLGPSTVSFVSNMTDSEHRFCLKMLSFQNVAVIDKSAGEWLFAWMLLQSPQSWNPVLFSYFFLFVCLVVGQN